MQINFVVSLKNALKDEKGNLYKYVLSCLEVFPRYIFLRSLKSKDTTECVNQKKEISMICGSPKILHCDKGLEFQGILLLTYSLHLLTLQRLCTYIVKLFFV